MEPNNMLVTRNSVHRLTVYIDQAVTPPSGSIWAYLSVSLVVGMGMTGSMYIEPSTVTWYHTSDFREGRTFTIHGVDEPISTGSISAVYSQVASNDPYYTGWQPQITVALASTPSPLSRPRSAAASAPSVRWRGRRSADSSATRRWLRRCAAARSAPRLCFSRCA